MRRKSMPAGRQSGSLIRRLDAAAAWINPFLMAIAAMLLIIDLSCGVALVVARLPITRIAAPSPAVQPLPPGTVSMAVQ
ncbi:MAG: hypothetical protein WB697_00555 [Stellaceae bacterium]